MPHNAGAAALRGANGARMPLPCRRQRAWEGFLVRRRLQIICLAIRQLDLLYFTLVNIGYSCELSRMRRQSRSHASRPQRSPHARIHCDSGLARHAASRNQRRLRRARVWRRAIRCGLGTRRADPAPAERRSARRLRAIATRAMSSTAIRLGRFTILSIVWSAGPVQPAACASHLVRLCGVRKCSAGNASMPSIRAASKAKPVAHRGPQSRL